MYSENESGYELLSEKETTESTYDGQPTTRRRLLLICLSSLSTAMIFILVISTINNSLDAPEAESTAVIPPPPPSCQAPALRQEWRMLSLDERREYVKAVQCLSTSSSRLGLNTTRYDDFVYSHLGMFNTTHRVDISLPWHRWYIQQYETALRNECGYMGYLAYWDWTLDTASPRHSPIWSPTTGFGGNGSFADHCVDHGPLAHFAPQYPSPHCLRRDFSARNMYGWKYTTALVEELISSSWTYEEFRLNLEDGPHRWVHRGIGGEIPLPWSTNDPVFFLHHAQIDRLWTIWQKHRAAKSLENSAVSERNGSQTGAAQWELPHSLRQEPLRLYGLGEDKAVIEVMSTDNDLLCYNYPMV